MNGTIALPVDITETAAARQIAPEPWMREGIATDAEGILRLIEANLVDGHLLPRNLNDLALHAHRFVVLEHEDRIVGCAELAPLSRAVAEVRSLVIDEAWRGRGLGPRLIAEVGERARRTGFTVLCAFTHDPHHFVRLGFSSFPHVWFPEKVASDCIGCPKFRSCGQHALALPLNATGALPNFRRLREPLMPGHDAGAKNAALPPVRLRVIA